MRASAAFRRVVAATVVLGATPALAAGGEHGSDESALKDLLWQALNLAILLAVLVYAARKPLLGFFADRRKQIRGELDDAAQLLSEAEFRYNEWQRKLIDLERELEEIRVEGRRRAEEEREAILAEAQVAAERIHREATAAVEQELRRAQKVLRDESAVLATEMAERILRERMSDSDGDRLLDEFIARVEPSANESRG